MGVETVDGTQYLGDKVVLAAGAWSPTLVDLEDQCCSKVSGTICTGRNIMTNYMPTAPRRGSTHTSGSPRKRRPHTRTSRSSTTATLASFSSRTSTESSKSATSFPGSRATRGTSRTAPTRPGHSRCPGHTQSTRPTRTPTPPMLPFGAPSRRTCHASRTKSCLTGRFAGVRTRPTRPC